MTHNKPFWIPSHQQGIIVFLHKFMFPIERSSHAKVTKSMSFLLDADYFFLTDENYLSQLIAGRRVGSDVTSSARVLGSRSVGRGTDSIPASPNMITVRWWSCHVWTFQTLPLIACRSPLKFFNQVFLSLHRSISIKYFFLSIEVSQPSLSVPP